MNYFHWRRHETNFLKDPHLEALGDLVGHTVFNIENCDKSYYAAVIRFSMALCV
jgi:hypothetical protein